MADGSGELDAVEARALGDALRLSARSVRRRADKERWPSATRTGVGGKQLVYPLATLPEEVRDAVKRFHARQAAEAIKIIGGAQAGRSAARKQLIEEAVDALVERGQKEAGDKLAAALTDRARARMEAKQQLLVRLDTFAQLRGNGICAAMEEFCEEYNSGRLHVPPEVRRQTTEDLHPATLRRWRRMAKKQGAGALAGSYGNRKGSGGIDCTPQLREFLLGVLVEKPHVSARLMHDLVEARMPDVLPARRTLERWLVSWKRTNAEVFLAVTNPDAWKNRYLVAFGSYAEGFTRANQQWMLDSTPADLQLLDGRHNIVGVIDVATRRVKFHVSKNSTAEAVCQLIRRTILEWGVPESVKMDNGRDYASHRVAGLLMGLSIEARFSTPFSPQEKPFIERVFGTFSRHALELLPGFSGHDVAQAQAIRARKSFAEQLHAKNKVIEAQLTAAELQEFCDRWVNDYYQHEPHKGEGMDGMSPFEKTAQLRGAIRVVGDVRALDLLLGAGAVCTVTKKGVRLDKLTYIAPELERAMGQKVLVRRDDGDMGRIVVYHEDAFLCVAECPSVTGVDRSEVAAEAKARQRERVQDARAQLRKAGRKEAAGDLARELFDSKARKAASLAMLPTDNVVHLTPHLEAASLAADQLEAWQSGDAGKRGHDAAVMDSIVHIAREAQQADESAEDRFKWALDALLAGETNEFDARRLRIYRDTPEFQARWDFFTEFGAGTFGLADSYNALLPADALFHQGG